MSPSNQEKTPEVYGTRAISRESTNATTKVARNRNERRSIDVFEKDAIGSPHFANHSIDSLKRFNRHHSTMKQASKDTSVATGKNTRTMSTRNTPVTPGGCKEPKIDSNMIDNPDLINLRIKFSDEEITTAIDFKETFVNENGDIAADETAIPAIFIEISSKIDRLCDNFPKIVPRELKGIVIAASAKKEFSEHFTLSHYVDTDYIETQVTKNVADTIHKKLFDSRTELLTVTFDLEIFLLKHQDVYERIRPAIEKVESIAEEASRTSRSSRSTKKTTKSAKRPSNISYKSKGNDDNASKNDDLDEKSQITECTGMAKINKGYNSNNVQNQTMFQNSHQNLQQKQPTGPRMRMSRNMNQQRNRLADIPMKSLDIKHVPTIPVCDRTTLTESQRHNQLYTLAEFKIPDERKRNPISLNSCDEFDKVCVLAWYENFSMRGLRNGIYIPPLSCHHPKSYMGMEWESGFCPSKLFDKAQDMDAAVLADLRYTCSKNCSLMSILSNTSFGYQTLKNILVRHCPVLKEGGIADQSHLAYVMTDSIPRRTRKVKEYVLQNRFLGQNFSPFQQFMLVTSNLPPRIKALLEDRAKFLISSDSDCNIAGQIPFEITLDQCATWIMSEIERNGYNLSRIVAKPSVSHISAATFAEKYIAALRARKCWGCGKDGHTLNECPTHCITPKANLKNKTDIVKREPYVRPNKPGSGKPGVRFVGETPSEPDAPAISPPTKEPEANPVAEPSLNDLTTAIGNLATDEAGEPSKIEDLDQHLVAHIYSELSSEHQSVCKIGHYDETDEYDYGDDDFDSPYVRSLTRDNLCHECGSNGHPTHACPRYTVCENVGNEYVGDGTTKITWENDSSFECSNLGE